MNEGGGGGGVVGYALSEPLFLAVATSSWYSFWCLFSSAADLAGRLLGATKRCGGVTKVLSVTNKHTKGGVVGRPLPWSVLQDESRGGVGGHDVLGGGVRTANIR